ncbi:hypothetical protein [Dehalococcoides mccartyi]|jgi:hypothetical protein|uniref:hypothetical protein n=1 Tax=Dehalococcoides mccartyi TaxID=61435 RepID=UPI0003C84E50|nr:hypothetical protein [Dehalococcoides mccartyi]AHB14164.1 sensor histidine kinase [Dehalococcoides mccartyi GY50]
MTHAKVLRNRDFWVITGILAVLAVIYYAFDISALNWLALDEHLGITRHSFASNPFLLPVFMAAWRLGFGSGLLCILASVLIVMPRVLTSPWKLDVIAETIILCCIGIVIS